MERVFWFYIAVLFYLFTVVNFFLAFTVHFVAVSCLYAWDLAVGSSEQ